MESSTKTTGTPLYNQLKESLKPHKPHWFHPFRPNNLPLDFSERQWIEIIPNPIGGPEDIDINLMYVPDFECPELMVSAGVMLELLSPLLAFNPDTRESYDNWYITLFDSLIQDLRDRPLNPFDRAWVRLLYDFTNQIGTSQTHPLLSCALYNLIWAMRICSEAPDSMDRETRDQYIRHFYLDFLRASLQFLLVEEKNTPLQITFRRPVNFSSIQQLINYPSGSSVGDYCSTPTFIDRIMLANETLDPRQEAERGGQIMQAWADLWQSMVQGRLAFRGQIEG